MSVDGEHDDPEQGEGWSPRQQMLTLSFLAYVGMVTVKDDPRTLGGLIGGFLDTLPPVAGRWRVVWGPAISPGLFTDKHLAYAVEDVERPEQVVVVIRGTNPLALESLFVELGEFTEQTAWELGDELPAEVGDPQISVGIAKGLECLLEMTPAEGLPGAGSTLLEFADTITKDPKVALTTTGHSLGGTLASTLALRFEQTLAPALGVACVSFAGFSAGNRDFARYSDETLTRCDRVHGSLDTVPRMYERKGLRVAPRLYEPDIPRSRFMSLGVKLALAVMAKRGVSYRQIKPRAPALDNSINPTFDGFFEQMMWQHTQGYVNALGLEGVVDLWALLEAGARDPEPRGE